MKRQKPKTIKFGPGLGPDPLLSPKTQFIMSSLYLRGGAQTKKLQKK